MIAGLGWQPDGAPPRIRFGDRVLALRDAYAQWSFGHGRPYAAGADMPRDDPSDFAFAVLPGATLADAKIAPAPEGGCPDDPTDDHAGVVGLLPLRASAITAEPAFAPEAPEGPPPDVITGVIDDGINVFHDRFRNDGESRVDFAWVQDADAPPGAHVPFGRELTSGDISAAIASGRPDATLMRDHGLTGDRGGRYRPSLLDRAVSHGTHVADLAAGGGGPGHRLITVQLPALGTNDTSGSALIAALELAAQYVYERAALLSRAHGRAIPVVLNISYALSGGARTGGHYLERRLRAEAARYREAVAAWGKAPTPRALPAGNSHLGRGHASKRPGAARLDLPVRLQPQDRTDSFVEMWLQGSATSASLRIAPPGGPERTIEWADLRAADPHVLRTAAGDVVARVSVDAPDGSDDPAPDALYWRILVAMAPTTRTRGRPGLPPGLWRISVGTDDADAPIRAWIQRDDNIGGFGPRGRQPYFDDPGYAEWDGPRGISVADPGDKPSAICRDGTISGLATGADVDLICVTGIEANGRACAPYAAAAAEPDRAAIVAAASDASARLGGVLGAGTLSGSRAVLNGTSVAAPQVARLLAAHLAGLNTADPATFDPRAFLSVLGDPPPRPSDDRPERVHRPEMRETRLGPEGVILETPLGRQNVPDGIVDRGIRPY